MFLNDHIVDDADLGKKNGQDPHAHHPPRPLNEEPFNSSWTPATCTCILHARGIRYKVWRESGFARSGLVEEARLKSAKSLCVERSCCRESRPARLPRERGCFGKQKAGGVGGPSSSVVGSMSSPQHRQLRMYLYGIRCATAQAGLCLPLSLMVWKAL